MNTRSPFFISTRETIVLDVCRLQPAFFASLEKNPYTLTGINDVVKFEDVRVNRGEGYNNIQKTLNGDFHEFVQNLKSYA
jgi:hypothetical protein